VPAPCRAEGACRGVMGGSTAKLTTGHVVPRGAASLMHTPSWGSKRTVATWWRMMEARWAGTELLTWLKARGQVAPLASIMSTRYGLPRGSRKVGTSLHPLDPRHLRPNSVSTVMRGQTIANRLSPTAGTSVCIPCCLPTLAGHPNHGRCPAWIVRDPSTFATCRRWRRDDAPSATRRHGRRSRRHAYALRCILRLSRNPITAVATPGSSP
jgi:hypothetical protein